MHRSFLLLIILVTTVACVTGSVGVFASSILVATPATLEAVLAKAEPGSTIMLSPGNYHTLSGHNIGGAEGAPLTLRASHPANPPRFTRMDLRDPQHLVLEGLVFDYHFSLGDPLYLRPFQIIGGTDVVLRDLLFDGDDAQGHSEIDDGSPTAFGLALTGLRDMTIEGSEIRGFFRGLVVARSQDVTVQDNKLHSLRSDGMNFAQVQRVAITGNTIRDFRSVPESDDHADMIQFWTNKTTAPSRDIVIRGNLLNSGMGAFTQSIFMRNEEVDTGRAGREMFYRNVTIEDNFILNAHLHGITVGEARGLVIRGNTVVRNPTSEGSKLNPSLWTPMIQVKTESELVLIERNVVAKIAGYNAQRGWELRDNLLVQDRSRMEANHYSRVFVGGDPRSPASFAPLLGGPLDDTGIGAPLTKNAVTGIRLNHDLEAAP